MTKLKLNSEAMNSKEELILFIDDSRSYNSECKYLERSNVNFDNEKTNCCSVAPSHIELQSEILRLLVFRKKINIIASNKFMTPTN